MRANVGDAGCMDILLAGERDGSIDLAMCRLMSDYEVTLVNDNSTF